MLPRQSRYQLSGASRCPLTHRAKMCRFIFRGPSLAVAVSVPVPVKAGLARRVTVVAGVPAIPGGGFCGRSVAAGAVNGLSPGAWRWPGL